jgi:hypothetical protein
MAPVFCMSCSREQIPRGTVVGNRFASQLTLLATVDNRGLLFRTAIQIGFEVGCSVRFWAMRLT